MGHYGALLGKALDVLGLAAQERLRNKQGEIGVLCTCFLEHLVQLLLHLFPDGIAIGLDDHTSANCRLLGEVGFNHKIVIPLTVIISAFR